MIIYLVTCRANDKKYVGVTTRNLAIARRRLLYDAKRTPLREDPIYEDIRKYGGQNFTIVKVADSDQQRVRADLIHWIHYFESRWPNGYNRAYEGDDEHM